MTSLVKAIRIAYHKALARQCAKDILAQNHLDCGIEVLRYICPRLFIRYNHHIEMLCKLDPEHCTPGYKL